MKISFSHPCLLLLPLLPLLLWMGIQLSFAQPTPLLTKGHSHNDYLQKRPLLKALDNGFCSIEVDVFLSKGELVVAHTRAGIRKRNTLERLYLDPLEAIIAENDGHVYPADSQQLILMIDLKTGGRETLDRLAETLRAYRPLLTLWFPDSIRPGPLRVLLSGDGVKYAVAADSMRFAAIDGGFGDMDARWPPAVLPRVSARYGSHFKWRGRRTPPAGMREQLDSLVRGAHRNGRQIRFWGVPNREAVWEMLLEAGVDWIHVDKLQKFRRYMEQRDFF